MLCSYLKRRQSLNIVSLQPIMVFSQMIVIKTRKYNRSENKNLLSHRLSLCNFPKSDSVFTHKLFAPKNTSTLPDDARLLRSARLSQLLADSGGGGCKLRCRFLELSFAESDALFETCTHTHRLPKHTHTHTCRSSLMAQDGDLAGASSLKVSCH